VSARDIWLIGCGTMGGAMLRRWLAAGIPATRVTVIDPAGDADVPEGVRHVSAAPDEPAPALAVLAVKPQQLDAVVADLAWQGEPPLLLSILAGVEAATLRTRLGVTHVIRAMPNLPVLIGHGVVTLWSDSLNDSQRAGVDSLAKPLGTVEWIAEESQFHAVTALAGSGPGFVLRIVEAMAAAGTRVGLPADQALRLAVATVEGSAALAAATGEAPRALANRVASKGGTTQAGLDVLDSDGVLNRLFADTIAAAARRSRELAEAAR
jgi:pyrroline-5-carboxylate reductase